MAPQPRGPAKPSTVHFIAMLRALGLAVSSFGISHAQIERLLCQRIIDGQQALRGIQAAPENGTPSDQARELLARKTAVEESGLARSDGRRDRAGGQRIGELLSGKFPRDAMPSRRRVEVCVDVFLEVLEERDPRGYAQGLYGTRQIWQELWLQADQGRMPALNPDLKIVRGYLGIALEQLGARHAEGADPAGTSGSPLTTESDDSRTVVQLSELVPFAGSAHKSIPAHVITVPNAEDAGRPSAPTADATAAGRTGGDAEELIGVRAERDRALRQLHVLARRVRRLLAALAVTTAAAVAAIGWIVLDDPAVHTVVQLSAPDQKVIADQRVRFDFRPDLPGGRAWALRIVLTVVAADQLSACTFTLQVTAHLEADGKTLPSFTSRQGQTTITYDAELGAGAQRLALVVTRLGTDPQCLLHLDPAGSQAAEIT